MVTDWNKIQNILLLQHGEICITAYGTRFMQEPLFQKHMEFRSNAVRCKWLRRHVRCIDQPGIILFTKDATCFARIPYDYNILVYNLKASTPTKNMLYFSTTNAKEKYMGIGFDFPAAIGVYFTIFCFCQIILL